MVPNGRTLAGLLLLGQAKHVTRFGRKKLEPVSLNAAALSAEPGAEIVGFVGSQRAATPRGGVGVGVRSIPVTVPGFGNSHPGWGSDPARPPFFF